MLPSRIDKVHFRGRTVYVKRDDLIDSCLSGNKYRKLYTLLKTPKETYKKIISYGGAQSNAMYALACLCKQKGWEFHYYTKTLPQYLKEGAEGNLEQALGLGMLLHELPHEVYKAKIGELQGLREENTLMISQGGADEMAKEGVSVLAEEIKHWKKKHSIDNLCVVLPSGTGTTALYLNEALVDEGIMVYTSVLVGDREYQIKQWERLSAPPYPQIFYTDKKRRFANPYPEYLQIQQELHDETGIVFDLIYAPLTWLQMCEQLGEDTEILYIHTGGVSGNKTMRERYTYSEQKL